MEAEQVDDAKLKVAICPNIRSRVPSSSASSR